MYLQSKYTLISFVFSYSFCSFLFDFNRLLNSTIVLSLPLHIYLNKYLISFDLWHFSTFICAWYLTIMSMLWGTTNRLSNFNLFISNQNRKEVMVVKCMSFQDSSPLQEKLHLHKQKYNSNIGTNQEWKLCSIAVKKVADVMLVYVPLT